MKAEQGRKGFARRMTAALSSASLIAGMAFSACGGSGDDSSDEGADNGDKGGTGSGAEAGQGTTGGSSTGGSVSVGGTGQGGSDGGADTGGSSTGGSSTGGSSTGGSATGGSGGGCMAGQTNLFDSPECEDFFTCVYESACADAGAQEDLCIQTLKQVFQTMYPACVPSGDVESSCDMVKADPSVSSMYPECID